MTEVQMPARRWGDEDEPEAAPPHVLISSRDGAPVPDVAGPRKLAACAESHGWSAVRTFALAAVPEQRHKKGTVKKRAHLLASIAVRLVRAGVRGYAMWTRELDSLQDLELTGWRFSGARIAGEHAYGAESIVDRLAVRP